MTILFLEEALKEVSRVEVIDKDGRSYIKYFDKGGLTFSLQDECRTLKLFIKE